MKIALSFDGTIVNSYHADYLDQERFLQFCEYAKQKRWTIEVVTSRPASDYGFVERKANGLKVQCCDGHDNKIKYLKKRKFDIVIDANPATTVDSVKYEFQDWETLNKDMVESKLYSPGPVKFDRPFTLEIHHRSDEFAKIVRNCQAMVGDLFQDNQPEILFTQGSGTSAIEAAIVNLCNNANVVVHSVGEFGNRAGEMVRRVAKNVDVVCSMDDINLDEADVFIGIVFETSRSVFNDYTAVIEECKKRNIYTIMDMVSALGYYTPPDADIICSSASKLLKALPAVGILAYRPGIEEEFDSPYSYYFDLKRYISSASKGQTPHTSMMPQLMTLDNKEWFTKQEMDDRCRYFHKFTKNKSIKLVNEINAPVLTFEFDTTKRVDKFFELLNEFNIMLYYNRNYMTTVVQVSMFNEDESTYKFLAQLMEKTACEKL